MKQPQMFQMFELPQAVSRLLPLLTLSGVALAQVAFSPAQKQHLPADLASLHGGRLADFDGDGDADAVLLCGREVTLLQNVGEGRLMPWASALPAPGLLGHRVVVGDIDGDRDVDILVFGNASRAGGNRHYVLVNDGRGRFVDGTVNRGLPPASEFVESALLEDVDGNGSPDLFLASTSMPVLQDRLLINDGRGRFSDQTAQRLPTDLAQTSAVAAGDLDGDGDQDLVLARVGLRNQSQILENIGAGRFRAIAQLPVDDFQTQALALGDIDGDRDLDVFLANQDFARPIGEASAVWRNDGRMRFSDISASALPSGLMVSAAVALVDVDGDRALDLVVSDYRGVDGVVVLANNGAGQFRARLGLGLRRREAGGAQVLIAGDVDGDRRVDLLFGGWRPQLWLNSGRGILDHAGGPRRSAFQSTLLFDADRDGDLDLLSSDQLRINIGGGAFESPRTPPMPSLLASPWVGASGDFDGDGDIDVFLGVLGVNKSTLLRRNAQAGYSDDRAAIPQRQWGSLDVVALDADGDGDLDLFSAETRNDYLLLNDGAGRFVQAPAGPIQADGLRSNAAAAGDVDGDGDIDLVLAKGDLSRSDPSDRLWLNDGSGRFSVGPGFPVGSSHSTGVVLGDLDGDGDLDCLVTAGRRPVGSRVVPDHSRLLRNDGGGRFTDVTSAQWPHPAGDRRRPLLGDFDGDSDLDLLVTNSQNAQELWLNDGQARFVAGALDGGDQLGLEGGARAVGDVDLDGDLDVLTAESIHRNLDVDLFAPRLAIPGREYRFELGFRVGRAPAGAQALLMVGLARAARPLDVPGLGRWLLDPAGAVTLPPVGLPPVTGQAELSVVLPITVGFRAPILVQGLIVPAGGGAGLRITPAIVDFVRR